MALTDWVPFVGNKFKELVNCASTLRTNDLDLLETNPKNLLIVLYTMNMCSLSCRQGLAALATFLVGYMKKQRYNIYI